TTREAVIAVVDDRDRLLVILISDDRSDRPEDFLARNDHVIGDVSEQRRLDVPTFGKMGRTAAARDEARTIARSARDVTAHAVELPTTDHRPHLRFDIERIPDANLLESRGKRFGDFLAPSRRHENTAEGGALLAGNADQIGHDARNDGFDLCVIENDRG